MSSTTEPARRSRTVVALGVFVPAVVLLAACGGSKRAAPRTTTTRPKAPTATTTQRSAVTTSSPCGRVTTPPRWQHVIVVIFENHRHGDVIDNRAAPYATELARECGTATNWSDAGSAYPSLPNYIGLTSGQDGKDVGITGDCDAGAPPDKACTTGADNIFRQARKTGVSVKSYQEDMPGNCHIGEGGGYREHHNPAVYYRGDGGGDWSDCQKNDVPMGSLSGAATSSTTSRGTHCRTSRSSSRTTATTRTTARLPRVTHGRRSSSPGASRARRTATVGPRFSGCGTRTRPSPT